MSDTDWGSVGTDTATGAATGAAIGSIVPGVGTLVGAGVGAGLGAVSGYFGGKAGNAARKAAEEQQYQALVQYNRVMASRREAVGMVMTPAAMVAHDQALQTQERNVQRQETLVKSLDPMLIDAGKQAKSILDGKSAPVLQNIKDQRSAQRNQMMDNLRSRLGPGAETSSAGMQSMQKFDLDTASMLDGAQQQYLDKVSNISINGAATVGDSLNRVNATLSQINTQGPEVEAARIMAGYAPAEAQAGQGMVNAAGREQMGEVLKAQSSQQFMGQMLQLGGAAIGAMGDKKDTGGGGGDKNKPPPPQTPQTQSQGTNYGGYGTLGADNMNRMLATPGSGGTLFGDSGFGGGNVNVAGAGMTVTQSAARGSNPANMRTFGYRPGAAAGGYTVDGGKSGFGDYAGGGG